MNTQKEVENFAKSMQIEIDNNANKGSILDWQGLESKVSDLEYHKAKLMLAIKENNRDAIREFIADCSNILMSIGYEFDLYKKEPVNKNTTSKTKDEVFDKVSLDKVERTDWRS